MDARALLAGASVSVVSGEPDVDLTRIAQTIGTAVIASGRAGLEAALGDLAGLAKRLPSARRTLDLIGHTRTSDSLLSLGDWLIDGDDAETIAVFRRLADGALPRLGIHAVRLLGCHSATSARGRATIGRLAGVLGLDVMGATQLLHAGYYRAGGFDDRWDFLLVSAGELHTAPLRAICAVPGDGAHVPYTGHVGPRVLDVDALPAVGLDAHTAPCPRYVATEHTAQQILTLVRCREGAPMPGVAASPSLEIALPSREPGAYHIAHVVLGAFLRFYPDGMTGTALVFPIADADALHRLVNASRAGA